MTIPITWEEVVNNFPGERVAELRKEIVEKSRAGVPKEVIMAEYRLSESAYYEILKRYGDKMELEDFVDKPKKPKKPSRKLSDEDYEEMKKMFRDQEENIKKHFDGWQSKNAEAPRPVGPVNTARQYEKMVRGQKGCRRLAVDFNKMQAEAGSGKTVSKSQFYNVLSNAGLTPKARRDAEIDRPDEHLHRRSNPCVEFQMDTSKLMLAGATEAYIVGIIDIFNSGIPVCDCSPSKNHGLVLKALKRLRKIVPHGALKIKMDHGSEFEDWRVQEYCQRANIKIVWNDKGKPWQNGFIERWFLTLKIEYLCLVYLRTVREVRRCLRKAVARYNIERGHSSFNYRTPLEVIIDWFDTVDFEIVKHKDPEVHYRTERILHHYRNENKLLPGVAL